MGCFPSPNPPDHHRQRPSIKVNVKLTDRMRVIDSITPLLVHSKLFDDPEKKRHAQGKIPWKKKKNLTHLGLKIGQGGTLDPLADGVLGGCNLPQ